MEHVEWVNRPDLRRPMAMSAFDGWGDAGSAATTAVAHVVAQLDSEEPFARINPEPFFDFTQRRPLVELDADGVRSVHWPRFDFYGLRPPGSDRDLVVLIGEEPHLAWRLFTRQVVDVMTAMGVDLSVTIGAFIGQVTHTLPVPLVGVASNRDLIDRHRLLSSGYQGPTGITGVLTDAFTKAGWSTISVWAAVPHYLSAQTYPPGALALLEKALEITGLDLDVSALRSEAAEFLENVDSALGDNPELKSYVEQLTSQLRRDLTEDPGSRLVDEIERYLRSGEAP